MGHARPTTFHLLADSMQRCCLLPIRPPINLIVGSARYNYSTPLARPFANFFEVLEAGILRLIHENKLIRERQSSQRGKN